MLPSAEHSGRTRSQPDLAVLGVGLLRLGNQLADAGAVKSEDRAAPQGRSKSSLSHTRSPPHTSSTQRSHWRKFSAPRQTHSSALRREVGSRQREKLDGSGRDSALGGSSHRRRRSRSTASRPSTGAPQATNFSGSTNRPHTALSNRSSHRGDKDTFEQNQYADGQENGHNLLGQSNDSGTTPNGASVSPVDRLNLTELSTARSSGRDKRKEPPNNANTLNDDTNRTASSATQSESDGPLGWGEELTESDDGGDNVNLALGLQPSPPTEGMPMGKKPSLPPTPSSKRNNQSSTRLSIIQSELHTGNSRMNSGGREIAGAPLHSGKRNPVEIETVPYKSGNAPRRHFQFQNHSLNNSQMAKNGDNASDSDRTPRAEMNENFIGNQSHSKVNGHSKIDVNVFEQIRVEKRVLLDMLQHVHTLTERLIDMERRQDDRLNEILALQTNGDNGNKLDFPPMISSPKSLHSVGVSARSPVVSLAHTTRSEDYREQIASLESLLRQLNLDQSRNSSVARLDAETQTDEGVVVNGAGEHGGHDGAGSETGTSGPIIGPTPPTLRARLRAHQRHQRPGRQAGPRQPRSCPPVRFDF